MDRHWSLRPGTERGTPRRILALYVAAIVGPALILLVLGIQAVQRQRHAIEQLARANRQLLERTVAAAIESRLVSDAELCLREASAVVAEPTDWTDLSRTRDLRLAFQAVAEHHAIAKALFLIEDGIVRVPKTQVTLPPIAGRLAMTPDHTLSGLLDRAEAVERAGRPDAALQLYSRLAANAKEPSTAALAFSRMAHCFEELGQAEKAAALHRRLIDEFQDAYDSAGRPYALIAAVQWNRLSRRNQKEVPDILRAVQRDLATGRWDLDADAADYFAAELSVPGPAVSPAPYIELMTIVRALRGRFQPVVDGATRAPQRVTLHGEVGRYEIYYTASRAKSGALDAIGLVVDARKVKEVIVPAVAIQTGVEPGRVTLQAASGGGIELSSALPGTEVVLAEAASPRGASDTTDIVVFGGTVIFVLSVLLLGVVLLLRDVSRDAATSRLQADLVGGVSHELKTPLTAIRMYGETLAARPDAPPETRLAFYDVIMQESDRLTRLVDRALDFSRIRRTGIDYVLEPVPLLGLVRSIADHYRPFLDQQNFLFEFESSGPDIERVTVNGDREALTRAVVNLLDNAVKYSEDDRWIRLSVTADGGEVCVRVQDRGIGMPIEDHDRIFQRFSRGNNGTGRGGYGLGLYLVRHVMTAHAGRVEVSSEAGRGSSFTLVLPVLEPGDGLQSQP
jgi:signal transduction histidine kinase